MKFEVNKKVLADIVSITHKLGDLVVGKGVVNNLDLHADANGVRAHVAHGSLLIDAKLGGTVINNGTVSIPLTNLASVLDLSGDRLTMNVVDKTMTYTAGRAKGRTSVNGPAKDIEPLDLSGRTKLPLSSMLSSAGLSSKKADKDTKSDYTFFFDAEKGRVRLDVGDAMRCVSVSTLADPEKTTKATVTASFLDAIAKRLDVADVLAEGGQFTVITPGLTVRFPQTSAEGQNTLDVLEGMRESEEGVLFGEITVGTKLLSTALKDAQSVLSDKDNSTLEVSLLGLQAALSSRSSVGTMETTCELVENQIKGQCQFAIQPVQLQGVLDLYKSAEFIKISVYPQALVMERLDKAADVESQLAIFSLSGAANVDKSVQAPIYNPPAPSVTQTKAPAKKEATPVAPKAKAKPLAAAADDFDDDEGE